MAMNISMDSISMTSPGDALALLRTWLRTERQRVSWTQRELARRSGVPAASISRLERTGLASTDALFRVAFALRQLEAVGDFLKERQRLASVPVSLAALPRRKVVQRVRMKKENQSCA